MAAITRKLLVGASTLSAGAAGGFAYWVDKHTKNLPAEEKGSLAVRMKDVAQTFIKTGEMKHPSFTKHQIKAEDSLSSRSSVVVKQGPNADYPTFKYRKIWPVVIPDQETQGVDLVAGSTVSVADSSVIDAIKAFNFKRCPSRLGNADLIVTGSGINLLDCKNIRKEFLDDIVWQAAKGTLDPNHPYSDMPVFYCPKDGEMNLGDLRNLDPSTKELILKGEFTIMSSYAHMKTRLSGDKFKEVPAVFVGPMHHIFKESSYI